MKNRIFPVLFFCFIAVVFPGTVFSQGNAEVHNAIKKLKERMGDNIKVKWHGRGRVTLDGKLSLSYPGTPEDAAKQFLRENAAIFQMDPVLSDMEVETIREDKIGDKHLGYYVSFKQTYKGLPVFDGGVGVNLKEDKSVGIVSSAYLSNINISITPTLSENEVIEIAKNDYIKNCQYSDITGKSYSCAGMAITFKGNPYVQLGILEHAGKIYLIYMINLATESPVYDSLEYKIDANTGTILEKGSLVVYFSGTGKVFDPNPVNTLNNTGLQDNRDKDDPAFNAAYSTKILTDITFNLNRYSLTGPYVDVTDSIERPFYFSKTAGHVLSTSGNFDFTRSPNEFEHVMVYYHIDTNQRYIQSLGFTTINNRGIKVDPHGLKGVKLPNAYYNPSPLGAGYLAFGEGGVDAAEDADVILHEYGHAIQDNQAPGKYVFNGSCATEAGAMGEGFGDYWAASNAYNSIFDQACIGEWVDVSYPDTDGDPICLRRVDGTKHYPEAIVKECHADGEIWSGALWDMFKSPLLGKTITDTIVLRSHFIINDDKLIKNPTFCDGAKAILQADEQLYGGTYKTIISDIMINRGIDVNVSEMIISGPDAPVDGDQYAVAGGLPPYTWSISKGSITQDGIVTVSGQCGAATVTVADACGNTATKDVRMPNGVWVTKANSAGVYLNWGSACCGEAPSAGCKVIDGDTAYWTDYAVGDFTNAEWIPGTAVAYCPPDPERIATIQSWCDAHFIEGRCSYPVVVEARVYGSGFAKWMCGY